MMMMTAYQGDNVLSNLLKNSLCCDVQPGNGGRRHTEPQGPSSFQLQQQPTSSVNARSRLSVASGTGTPAKTSKHEQKHMDMTTGRVEFNTRSIDGSI